MKITFCLILLFSLSFKSWAQDCDCKSHLLTIEQEMEENLASYQHQIIQGDQAKRYKKQKKRLNKLAKKVTTKKECVGLVARLISAVRDNHLFIDYMDGVIPYSSFEDTLLIQNFYGHEEVFVKPKNYQVSNQQIEGVWHFQDGSFFIEVIAHKTKFNDFIGILGEGDNLFWKKGQMKLEFFFDRDELLQCVYWRDTRRPQQFPVTLSDSTMEIGRLFTFYRDERKTTQVSYSLPFEFEFKVLSDSTSYLHFPSFMLDYTFTIDSLVKASLPEIEKRPNLIIDVRNNGGGGYDAIQPILPLLLEEKTYSDAISASMWVSPKNFEWYDTTKYDYAYTQQDSLEEASYVDSLRKYIGKYTPYEFEQSTLDTVYAFPQKIGILANRWSASMAESFLLTAMDTKKATIYGENSGGLISYGDWRPFEIPELDIWISITTLNIINKYQLDLEKIGVSPDVLLIPYPESEWIELVKNDLEKQE